MHKLLAAALLFLVSVSSARAESITGMPPADNWNKVQSLPVSSPIEIALKHGQRIECAFVRLTEESLIAKELSGERTYAKNDVARIVWMKPGSQIKNVALAGGVFFGLGFGLGYTAAPQIADQNDMPAGERIGAAMAVGGLMGGIAAVVAAAQKPGAVTETVYRAK